jgi:tRNA-Thr(GGU) m(6)t(6)A37 methyltransferase TsaA
MAAESPAGARNGLGPLRPIGTVHSPFRSSAAAPVQPVWAGPEAEGTVEVFEEYAAGLEDLDGFERIWIVSWFHRAGPSHLRVVPYLDRLERGLFATRAPARPNPIGISAVRLLGREGRFLRVGDLDLLDGTPVLDLKPYAAAFDSFPAVREGWLQGRCPGRGRADGRFEGSP